MILLALPLTASAEDFPQKLVQGALGDAGQGKLQQLHPPAACKNNDRQCLLLSYQEYKQGMFAEFRFWRRLEDAAASQDAMRATLAIKNAGESGQYRPIRWASVDQLDVDTIAAGEACRKAILDLKYMLTSISLEKGNFQTDRREYLKDAKQCEKAGGMAPLRSTLR